jgi:dTDP-4-dehydrorhamnose reductase
MLGHVAFGILSERFETYATFRGERGAWRTFPMYRDHSRLLEGVDGLNLDSVAQALARTGPDVVLNCIGVIKQLKEAADPLISLELNALFPHRLARLCQIGGARLIHVSTDCVFSGRKGNYREQDEADALDLYGRSKLLGEVNQPGCLTLRTSIIGRDFVKNVGLIEWFLSNRGGQVTGYTKAIYSGLTTLALSQVIAELIAARPDLSGLYHVASPAISKYELLRRIREQAGLNIDIIPSDTFFCDRSLDSSRFQAATAIAAPEWSTMLAELVRTFPIYDQWRQTHGLS